MQEPTIGKGAVPAGETAGTPDATPSWAAVAAEEPAPAAPTSTATPSGPSGRRVAGIAALVGAVAIGALALGIALGGGTSNDTAPVAAVPAVNAPVRGSDVGWTAPNGRTGLHLAEQDGRGIRGGYGGSMISITAIDGTKLSLQTENGWTRTIDAAGATITKDGQAVQVSDLKVGDRIVFRETRNDDGTYTITAIEVIQPSVVGIVKSVSGSSVTLTTFDGGTSTVALTGSTTYTIGRQAATKDAVVAGARIAARGTLGSDGSLTATSVEIVPAMAAGTVTEKGTSSLTLTVRDGTTLVVKVTSSTTYEVGGISSPTFADIKVGDVVMASGTKNADGSLTATVVRSHAAGEWGGPGMGGGGDGFGHGGMRGGRGGGWGFPGGPGFGPEPSAAPSGGANG